VCSIYPSNAIGVAATDGFAPCSFDPSHASGPTATDRFVLFSLYHRHASGPADSHRFVSCSFDPRHASCLAATHPFLLCSFYLGMPAASPLHIASYLCSVYFRHASGLSATSCTFASLVTWAIASRTSVLPWGACTRSMTIVWTASQRSRESTTFTCLARRVVKLRVPVMGLPVRQPSVALVQSVRLFLVRRFHSSCLAASQSFAAHHTVCDKCDSLGSYCGRL